MPLAAGKWRVLCIGGSLTVGPVCDTCSSVTTMRAIWRSLAAQVAPKRAPACSLGVAWPAANRRVMWIEPSFLGKPWIQPRYMAKSLSTQM